MADIVKTYQDKMSLLEQRGLSKVQQLDESIRSKGLITGILDADTVMMDGKPTRLAGYDAVESQHYDGESVIDTVSDNLYKTDQLDQVSKLTGKPVEQLTDDDFANVSNYQMTKLYNALHSNPTDTYNPATIYNKPDTAGMSVKASYDPSEIGHYGRPIRDIYVGNNNISNQFRMDELMNANHTPQRTQEEYDALIKQQNQEDLLRQNDLDGRVGETADVAQSSLVQAGSKYLRLLDTAIDAVGLGGISRKIDEVLGVAELDDRVMAQAELMADPEHGQAVADAFTGVKQSTREEYNQSMQVAEQQWKDGNYFTSLYGMAKNFDRLLADSAGSSATIMTPYIGAFIYAATRTEDQAIQYEQNNNEGKSVEDMLTDFGVNLALAVPEKLLIKMNIKALFSKLTGKSIAGKVALSGVGEGLQEYGEGIQETIATQKKGERTLGEIVTDPTQVFQGAVGAVTGTGASGLGVAIPSAIKNTVKGTKKVKETVSDKIADKDRVIDKEADTRVNEVLSVVQKNDIGTLSDTSLATLSTTLEQQLDNENLSTSTRTKVAKEFDRVKTVIAAKQSKEQITDSLNTSENPEQLLEEQIYYGSNPNLKEAAKEAGISEETFVAIQDKVKGFSTVEKEVRYGVQGYVTLGNRLSSLQKTLETAEEGSDTHTSITSQIKGVTLKLDNLYKSQAAKLVQIDRLLGKLAKDPALESVEESLETTSKGKKLFINRKQLENSVSGINKLIRSVSEDLVNLDTITKSILPAVNEKHSKGSAETIAGIKDKIQKITAKETKASDIQEQSKQAESEQVVEEDVQTPSEESTVADTVQKETIEDIKTEDDVELEERKAIQEESNRAEEEKISNAAQTKDVTEVKEPIQEVESTKEDLDQPPLESYTEAATEEEFNQALEDTSSYEELELEGKKDKNKFFTDYKAVVRMVADELNTLANDVLIGNTTQKAADEKIISAAKEFAEGSEALSNVSIENVIKKAKELNSIRNDSTKKYIERINEEVVQAGKTLDLVNKKLALVRNYRRRARDIHKTRLREVFKNFAGNLITLKEAYKGEKKRYKENVKSLNSHYKELSKEKDEALAIFQKYKNSNTETESVLSNSISTNVSKTQNNTKHLTVGKNKPSLLTSIDVGVGITHKMVKAVTKVIAQPFSRPDIDNATNKQKVTKEVTRLAADSPARNLLFSKAYRDENGNLVADINNNVVMAIHYALLEFLDTKSALIQEANLNSLIDQQNKGEILDAIAAYELLNSKGAFNKVVADSLGKAVLKHLNITHTKDMPSSYWDKLVADLGQTAILYGEEQGLVQVNTATKAEINKVFNNSADTLDSDTNVVYFVKLAEGVDLRYNGLQLQYYTDLLGIDTGSSPKEQLAKPKRGKKRKVRNNQGITDVAEDPSKALDEIESSKWYIDTAIADFIRNNVEVAKILLGYKPEEDIVLLPKEQAESQRSVNSVVERSIASLIDNDYTADTALYFNWFFGKNGRLYLDSSKLNPQTDKLHRFAVTRENNNVTINKSNKRHMDLFYYALAQAFGKSTDKMRFKNAVKFGKSVASLDMITLEKAISDGKFNTKESIELFYKDNPQYKGIEIEELGHFFQGIEAVKEYQNSEALETLTFTTKLSAEIDAVTSGFAIRLMQLPTLGKLTRGLLRKVGISNSTSPENFADTRSTKEFTDVYEMLAKAMKFPKYSQTAVKGDDVRTFYNNVHSLLPKVDKVVTPELRNLFKDPFMVFNYGAGITTAAKGVIRSMSDQYTRMFVKYTFEPNENIAPEDKAVYDTYKNAFEQVNELYLKAHKGNPDISLKEALLTKPLKDIKVQLRYRDGNKVVIETTSLEFLINRSLEDTVGKAIGNELESKFYPYIEANKRMNDAFSTMFELFHKEYSKRLSELKTPTVEDKAKLIDQLFDLFPAIRSYYTEDVKDGVPIYSKGKSDNKTTKASTHLNKDNKRYDDKATRDVYAITQEVEKSVSAGSVVPIHFMDGAMMVMSTLSSAKGFLAIHDAKIPPLTELDRESNTYNKNFYSINKDYSIVQAINDRLISAVTSLELTQKELDGIVIGIDPELKGANFYSFDTNKTPEGVPLTAILRSFKEFNSTVQSARSNLFDWVGSVQNMDGTPEGTYIVDEFESSTKEELEAERIREFEETEYAKALEEVSEDLDTLGSNPSKETKTSETNLEQLSRDTYSSAEARVELLELLDSLQDEQIEPSFMKYLKKLMGDIDNNLLDDINVFLDQNADTTYGELDKKNINVTVNNKSSYGQSAPEVMAHEMIHAITGFVVTNARYLDKTNILRQIEAIRNRAAKYITPEKLAVDGVTEQEAQELWDYMFNNPNGKGIEEFIAFSMTNPRVRELLSEITTKQQKEHKSFLDKVIDLANKLLDIFTGNYKQLDSDKLAVDSMYQLVMELSKMNKTSLDSVLDRKTPVETFYKKVRDLDIKAVDIFDKFKNYFDKEVVPPVEGATKMQDAIWLARYSGRLIVNASEYDVAILEQVLSSLGLKPEGLVQNMFRYLKNPDKFEKIIETLGLESSNIAQSMKETESTVKNHILRSFGFKDKKNKKFALTDKDAELITEVLIDTDSQVLYKALGYDRFIKLLVDDKVLGSEITKRLNTLKLKDPNNYNWYKGQIEALAYKLNTGIGNEATNLNAYNIAIGTTYKAIDPKNGVESLIDELVSLYALSDTNIEYREQIASLPANGIQTSLDAHHESIMDSERSVFNSKALMQKGYSKGLYDDTIEVVIRPKGEEETLRKQGFKKVYDIEGGAYNTPMAVYSASRFVSQTYTSGTFVLQNLVSAGTTFTQIASQTDDNTKAKVNEMKSTAEGNATKINDLMAKGKYNPRKHKGFIPIVNESGKVVDYRAVMTKVNRKKVLKQDTRVHAVLGATKGSTVYKRLAEDQNIKILNAVLEQADIDFPQGTGNVGLSGKEYLVIGDKDHIGMSEKDTELAERLFSLLPKNIQKKIKDAGGTPVRRDMVLNLFGTKDMSIANAGVVQAITPQKVQLGIRVLERIVKEIASIAKADIVLREPAVAIGNIISNIMFEVMQGHSFYKVARMQIKNAINLRKYLNNQKTIKDLEYVIALGQEQKGDQARVNRLKEELKKNPVHDLIEANLYQNIIEDISQEEQTSSGRMKRFIDQKTAFVPEFVKTGTKMLYMAEGTPVYTFMTQVTQYSDFVARATSYQLGLEAGKSKDELLYDILDTYINYDKPAHAIEQYLNDMGLMMFTKYAFRIQRVIKKASMRSPLSFALALAGILGFEMSTGWNIDSIEEKNVMSRNWMNLFYDPMEHVSRVFIPTGYEAAKGIASFEF